MVAKRLQMLRNDWNKNQKEFVEGSVHSTLWKLFNGMPAMHVAVEAAAGATADTIVAVVETAAPAAPAAPAKKRGAATGTPKAGATKKSRRTKPLIRKSARVR